MATLSNEHMTEREEVDFRVLRALSADPGMSQRQLANTARVSLGSVNYCIRGLAEKGLVKVRNFKESKSKSRYAYVLTPQGISERVRLTRRFLELKMLEYDLLKREIAEVLGEIEENDDSFSF